MSKSKRNARNLVRLLVGLLVALLLVLAVGALALLVGANSFRQSDAIARNVTVAGVDVGGLPRGEALTRLETEYVATLPTDLKLVHGDESFTYPRRELGAELQIEQALEAALRLGREGNALRQVLDRLWLMRSAVDLPVSVAVDGKLAATKIAAIAAQVNQEPVDARVTVGGDDEVNVVPGKPGIVLDETASLQVVTKALSDPRAVSATLASKQQDPNIVAADLAHLEVVLGSFSTPYSASKVDRTHNLHLAIRSINGQVVMPGDTFSANQTIGRRDEARGFREAPIFVNGEITPSTGGGVCQIATTIYNAALLAGLPVVERHHHSMPVHYADAGRDATVYWGQLDLRFRNDTSGPVVLLASMSGSRVHVRIVGKREAKKRVRVERSGISGIPFETVEKPDPTLDEGKRKVEEKGRKGVRVTVYRVTVLDDGSEKRETLHTDVYRAYKETVLVGAKKKPVAKPDVLPDSTTPGATKAGADATKIGTKPGTKPATKSTTGKATTKPVTKPRKTDD
jgi:vancomycin resistance protein YoaR